MFKDQNEETSCPDLIISQETCEVCAVHINQTSKIIKISQKRPPLYSMNPHKPNEINHL